MKERAELPKALIEHLPWQNETNPIWPATTFLIRRNLSKHLFPAKCSEAQAQQTLEIIRNALFGSPELDSPILLKAEELTPLDKEFLFEHFLCSESFQNTLAGQAFAVEKSSSLLAIVGIGDHLQLQLLDGTGDWEKAWNRLYAIEASLGQTLDYAYQPRFGYLTSDFSLCGTGLIVQAYLHVPALIHSGQLQETLIKQKDEEVAAAGMQGGVDEWIGDLLVLTNRFTLGVTEENISHALTSTAMRLVIAERTLRSRLKEQGGDEMKDQISRAYGLLMHSYQLQTKEALGALSLIKLGADLGWISGIAQGKLNEAFFRCRRAHLTYAQQDPHMDAQEIHRRRAAFLHKELQGASLLTDA
jgi:protein arginine kinase